MLEGKIEREWELLKRKVSVMIHKYIDRSLFEHVSIYTNAYELWSKLESMIQKKTPRNKAYLVRRLAKLEYNDDVFVFEIEDELQALLLLSSLPEIWEILVVTLSKSTLDRKLTTDTVSDSLLNEEARRKERDLPSQTEANMVENRGRKIIEEGMRTEEEARLKVMTSLEAPNSV
ncbi:hypothetical protein V6N13_110769 [Hibiscus sabdariffa]